MTQTTRGEKKNSKLFFFYLLVKENYKRGDLFFPLLFAERLRAGDCVRAPLAVTRRVLPSPRSPRARDGSRPSAALWRGPGEARKGCGPAGIAQSGLGPAQGSSDGALGAEQGYPSRGRLARALAAPPGPAALFFHKEGTCPDATEGNGFKKLNFF